MHRIRNIVLVGLLVLGYAFSAGAADKLWVNDFAAAKDRAKKENKLLFLDFTGSDWCGWCIKLKKEVFSQELFIKDAPKKFILVELDFPKKTKQDDKLKQQNQMLSRKYAVQGFPTIILADADGVEFARTGYRPGGPKAYLEALDKYVGNFREYEKLVQEAKKLDGIEKARKLDQALARLAENGSQRDREKLAKEIIALDKDGQAGLRVKYELPGKLNAIRDELNKSRDFDKALQELDKLTVEARAVPPMLQQVYLFQAGILIKGKGEKAAGIKKLELAQNVAPDTQTGKQLVAFIAKMKADNGAGQTGKSKK